MNYHKHEPIRTKVVDRVVSDIIVNDKFNANRGALSLRKQVHALIFEHKIISKYLQNMRFSLISACTFICGDTVIYFHPLFHYAHIPYDNLPDYDKTRQDMEIHMWPEMGPHLYLISLACHCSFWPSVTGL